ncbi:MAG: hypothetical protein ACRDD1_14060, partial [Planctomycetia bacterium]
REKGPVHGRFEIGADRFPDDDSYLFALDVVPEVKVLLVNGDQNNDPFENECLFLQTALSAGAEDDASAMPLGKGKKKKPEEAKKDPLAPGGEFARSLAVEEIPEHALNTDRLRNVSVLVMANCGQLNGQQYAWVREFVQQGGGLIVLPGEKVNADAYNSQFLPVPGPQKEFLAGVRFAPPVGDPQKFETFTRLAAIDFAHPVLSVFDDPNQRYLTTALVYRRFPLTFTEPRGVAWKLADFASDTPAFVESRFGDGVVLLASFPFNAKWSNLPLKPEFVPLVLRMVSHVQRLPELEAPTNVAAGATAEVSVVESWSPVTAGARLDDGKPAADAQAEQGAVAATPVAASPIPLQRVGARLVGAYRAADTKGFYRIDVTGGRVEQPKRASTLFAVNLSSEESDFTPIKDEMLKSIAPIPGLAIVDASAEAQQTHGAIGDEREVWRPLIFLLFGIIAVEFLLATLGGGRTEAGEPRTVAQRLRDGLGGGWLGKATGGDVARG